MNGRDVLAQFRVGKKLTLTDEQAKQKPLSSDNKAQDKLRVLDLAEKIGAQQDIFYASGQHKLLIVLQGMDTSGKDGTIAGVLGRVDPLGVRCVSFKAPSAAELAHDYLWRVHQQVPAKREMVVFNRSHYEDVLVPVAHATIDAKESARRLAHIRDFERMLAETGTVILKFFLHISKEEQKERLEARLAEPNKHWKFDAHDLEQRKYWDAYRSAYETAIVQTDASHAPWYVIPADSKTHRNLAIAGIVLATLDSLKLAYPPGNPDYAGLTVQ